MGCTSSPLLPCLSFSHVGARGIPASMVGREGYRRAVSLGIPIPRRRRVTRASRAIRHGQKGSALGHTHSDHDGTRSTSFPAPAATKAGHQDAAARTSAEATAATSPRQTEDRSSRSPLSEWRSEDVTRRNGTGAARWETALSRFQQRHLWHQGSVLRQRSAQMRQGPS